MKACIYCGRENDDTTRCWECGTELSAPAVAQSPVIRSRRSRITLGIMALGALVLVLVTVPYLLAVVPLVAILYSPIYVPFLLSFSVKSREWWGLRWSLRVASFVLLFILLAVKPSPDFGDDVAGNITGAMLTLTWVWGSGVACALGAVLLGLLLRLLTPVRTRVVSGPNQIHTHR
jgi:hypothetical protein